MKKTVSILFTTFCFALFWYFVIEAQDKESSSGTQKRQVSKKSAAVKVSDSSKPTQSNISILEQENITNDKKSVLKTLILSSYQSCMTNNGNESEFNENEKLISDSLGDIIETQPVWSNVHLEKDDGNTYLVRVFNADGENGSVRKLVYLKEDEQGFPQIVSKHLRPTKELLTKYLNGGRKVYDEVATRYISSTGVEVFLQTIDNQVKRLSFSFAGQEIECRGNL